MKSLSRILIVDDHPIMRQGLRQLIQLESDIEVCEEAASVPEAMEKIEEHNPDLVLADITMPGRNGLELVKDARAVNPSLQILVISMHDETIYAERVLKAGGRGYVMKDAGGEKILEAIKTVLTGNIYVSPQISSRILEIFSGAGNQGGQDPVTALSDRELEIFQLIGQGNETKEIAAQLSISPKTVEVHRLNIKSKLKIATATELLRYAVRWIESNACPNEP